LKRVNGVDNIPVDILFTWRDSFRSFVDPSLGPIEAFHNSTKANLLHGGVALIKLKVTEELLKLLIRFVVNYVKIGHVK